jgi:hypothetical protein
MRSGPIRPAARRDHGGVQNQVACILRRAYRASLQGNVRSRRKDDHRHLDHIGRPHVSSNEPAIVLFGYLRHGLIGRGVMLFGVILLVLNFLDGLCKLARLDWHAAYQIVMTFCYIALSVRLIQLILAFRGE